MCGETFPFIFGEIKMSYVNKMLSVLLNPDIKPLYKTSLFSYICCFISELKIKSRKTVWLCRNSRTSSFEG